MNREYWQRYESTQAEEKVHSFKMQNLNQKETGHRQQSLMWASSSKIRKLGCHKKNGSTNKDICTIRESEREKQPWNYQVSIRSMSYRTSIYNKRIKSREGKLESKKERTWVGRDKHGEVQFHPKKRTFGSLVMLLGVTIYTYLLLRTVVFCFKLRYRIVEHF